MNYDDWLTTEPEYKTEEETDKEESLKEEAQERNKEIELDLLIEDIYG